MQLDNILLRSQTEIISPGKSMKLSCEGWYTLVCKRLRDEQSREQDIPFTFLSALYQGFFHDGYLKSSEGHQVSNGAVAYIFFSGLI